MRETRLYQIGTFAAGNRLLDPDQSSVQARRPDQRDHQRAPRLPGLR